MYSNRNRTQAFTDAQYKLREIKFSLVDSSKMELPDILRDIETIISILSNLKNDVTGTFDEDYVHFLESLFITVKFQISYIQGLKSGDSNIDTLKNANKFNHNHLKQLTEKVDTTRISINKLTTLANEISTCEDIPGIQEKIKKLALVPLPYIDGIETDSLADFKRHVSSTENEEEEEIVPLMMSIRFQTDSELWANPQILKPNIQYTIKGFIKLNYLPENYTKIIIRHTSTTNDDYFILSLPEIELTDSLEYNISGQIVFKYPQNTFDPPVVIKLLSQLVSASLQPIYPRLIGYDELIAQIINDTTFKYPTGYKKLNKKAWNIGLEIKNELPQIEEDELDHFLILLSAILNYSGYCAQYGIYKEKTDISEDQFRDKLIEYISANSTVASDITKEGYIGGGRVEIRYKDIIAELKVEKNTSDRDKMIKQYKKQPLAYATATSADLSILCILDLTQKKSVPASPSKNIFVVPGEFHGFQETSSTSKLVVIVIDGNLKNPSSY